MKYTFKLNKKLNDWKSQFYSIKAIQLFPHSIGMLQHLFFCFLIFFLFRLRLFIVRYDDIQDLTLQQCLRIFGIGFLLDGVVVGYSATIPAIFLLFFCKRLSFFFSGFNTIYMLFLYITFIGAEIGCIYFFQYFDYRPNYLVLDHWKDFQLVETVFEVYPVPLVAISASCLFASVFFFQRHFAVLSHRQRKGVPIQSLHSGWKDRCVLFLILLLCGLLGRGTLDHRPINPTASTISKNRIANEIANSTIFNVIYEGIQRLSTKYVPVKSVIPVVDNEVALKNVRNYFANKGTLTNDSPNPIVTYVDTQRPMSNTNVVLIVMESMMAKLIGTLGGKPAASPEFDRLAQAGVLLENCYATGERTIQGLEAVVCSFPPLPGVGIVRRPQAQDGFTTLASVLKERGYRTIFFYGGQGIFDHKIGFFLSNGYDTFFEEKDFDNPIFKSPWGASDEDLYRRADKMFTEFSEKNQPFFGTILTSSLHSPWVYPEGKIEPFPKDVHIPPGFEFEEINNFKYADYALGEFFRTVQDSNYFDNTIFVIIGDHGVHLRGKTLIPVDEYRIGGLIYAPHSLKPERITRRVSQLDIAPTILSLLGGTYRTTFFGSDIFQKNHESEYAMMVYDKKRYGIIIDSMLTILTETGDNYAYRCDNEKKEWIETSYSDEHGQHARFSASILQVAEKLLQEKKYIIQ